MALVVFAVVAFSAGVAHAETFVWSRAIALDTGGVLAPVAVSCPSATQCTIVEGDGDQSTFDPWHRAPGSGRANLTPAAAGRLHPRGVTSGVRSDGGAVPDTTESGVPRA